MTRPRAPRPYLAALTLRLTPLLALQLALPVTAEALAPGIPRAATATAADPGDDAWWRPDDLVDYGVVAAATAVVLGVHSFAPPQGSGIGPDFDPAEPGAILRPELRDRLGRTHLDEGSGETVPAVRLGYAVPVVAAWLVLQEGLPGWIGGTPGTTRRVHDVGVGLAEALALTLAATEVLKFGFGRLRPDFQDRVRRHYCNLPDSQGVDCGGFTGPPLSADAAEADTILADGRRSFPSGHASTSLALATYASLVTRR